MPRRSPTHRLFSVVVRTLHLIGVVGVFATSGWGAPPAGWAELLVASGLVLVGDDLLRFGADWLRWAQSWAIIGKLLVFMACYALGEPMIGLWAALVIGSLISHAPGMLRHYPLVGAPGPCAHVNPPPGASS